MKIKGIWEKLFLTDKDYEYVTKGLAIGIGIGIIIGALFGEILFFFSFGGAMGIVGANIFAFYKKYANKHSS
jgi:hypothetical protein